MGVLIADWVWERPSELAEMGARATEGRQALALVLGLDLGPALALRSTAVDAGRVLGIVGGELCPGAP